MASHPPQNQPTEGILGTCAGDAAVPLVLNAMQVREQWMREWGRTEEEIAAYCQADKYPGSLEEEDLSLQAVRTLKGIDVERLFLES